MSLTTNELAKDLIYDIVRDFHGRVTSVSKLFQEVNSRLVVNGYGSIGWPTFQRLLKSDRRIAVVPNGVIRKMVVLKEKIIPTSKTPLEIRDYEDGGLEWPIRTTLYHYRYVDSDIPDPIPVLITRLPIYPFDLLFQRSGE